MRWIVAFIRNNHKTKFSHVWQKLLLSIIFSGINSYPVYSRTRSNFNRFCTSMTATASFHYQRSIYIYFLGTANQWPKRMIIPLYSDLNYAGLLPVGTPEGTLTQETEVGTTWDLWLHLSPNCAPLYKKVHTFHKQLGKLYF